MLPGSLIQTKARLSLKNKAFIKEKIRNKAVDSDTGSLPAGTAAPDSPSADSPAADSPATVSAIAVSKVDTAKSACTVPPPACASGYHSDSNGDCVSDVSTPEVFTHGKKTC
jgi:hypothetical protein